MPGAHLLLTEGLVSLIIDKIDGGDIIMTVQNNGEESNNKRVGVPGVPFNLLPISEQDIADIFFGVKRAINFMAAFFIQKAMDILVIHKVLQNSSSQTAIVAKIEKGFLKRISFLAYQKKCILLE